MHHQGIPFIPDAIRIKLISQHNNDPLVEHFGINKTRKLINRKYYWPSLRKNVEAYIKGYNVCLGLKTIRHKPYDYLKFLSILTHSWKNLSIDFVTRLPISNDWKEENYDSILVIIDWLIKMVHYEQVKVIIIAPELAEVILDMVVWHYNLPDSIVIDQDSLFTSKFWSSLCYFLGIKWKLSTAFYPQIDGQTKRQNITMEVYFWAFINFEQDD